ncbi:chemotaxis protein CheW [Rhodovulum sp. DZ06]|uniref:chemotaxis protein CheW n=1 Tax=Rhodovulum sp. DZ06 TaxID=3425126 RepID=UPI003D353060
MTLTPGEAGGPAAPGGAAPPPDDPGAGAAPADAPVPAPVPEASASIFGSFWLDGSEFALRVGVVREVVNEPETISAMPLSPPFMLGLFNLRGAIIPVVDLRRLLERPPREAGEGKVAIIEDGDLCVGLMFDHTGEVLNAQHAARVDFRPRAGKPKDVVVEGLLKLENGERIVQILDPYEILNLERVPVGDTLSRRRAETASTRGPRYSGISFQFGHTTCAMDLRFVREVLEAPQIMSSVLVHDCFVGVVNLRGTIIPVADFRNFMGDDAALGKSQEMPVRRKMLVVETDGGVIGLLIYSVNSIISFFRDEILKFSKLALPREDVVSGCLLSKENEIVILLDHDALRHDPILADTARRCREFHASEHAANALAKKKEKEVQAHTRRTFIVFTFERRFALETADVCEVIPYPDTLLHPPYTIEFVDGIISLREELITLINLRKLYGLPASRSERRGRVLIFRHEDRKYGITVDSVDEIVTTLDGKVAELKSFGQQKESKVMAEDVSGCIQSPTAGSVMVLDIASVLGRCFKALEGQKAAAAAAL